MLPHTKYVEYPWMMSMGHPVPSPSARIVSALTIELLDETNAAEQQIKHGKFEKEEQKKATQSEKERLNEKIKGLELNLNDAEMNAQEARERLKNLIHLATSANVQTHDDAVEAMGLFKGGSTRFTCIIGRTHADTKKSERALWRVFVKAHHRNYTHDC